MLVTRFSFCRDLLLSFGKYTSALIVLSQTCFLSLCLQKNLSYGLISASTMAGSTVAVIGGGPLGLMALKGFTEDGFDATLFESRDWVGGLWRHSSDESISAAANTIFNSSKYRSAITDFPMPDDMDDFPTAARLQRYFESYCDHFDLWPHIKLNSPIGKVKRNQNDWTLKIGSKGNSASRTEHFDKVVFACGTFLKPRIPDLEGIEKFEGKSLHSIQFTNAAQFKGKNVIVMGMHASAQDTVSGLSPHVSKVYLSHRSGVVIVRPCQFSHHKQR